MQQQQQQQQHTRAHTPTRIAYSLLYVFVRHPTTKCVWHNNHESRQRLWTPISKSCDSFLFTFAPDVRRRHLCRSRLTNTHTYSQPHAQTPTVYPTVVADLQRETKRNQREHKNESERPQTKQSRTNVGSRTAMGERTTESVSGRQRERERRQRCLCCCCCCCCWPREGAPLTCTLTSNTEQSNSYRQYSRTHPHTHINPPIAFFGVRDEHRSICQMFAGFIVPVLRLPICVLDAKRKREIKSAANWQWQRLGRNGNAFFSAHTGGIFISLCMCLLVCVSLFLCPLAGCMCSCLSD